ncbi:hypothetical protein ACLKMH_20225 [Psychromonas sp. KJ10-10]|uniref:hypothetical protein n=1 Tax=Psychromonas sp. KJ10-10 TaxID=3391823 RepID=UPI0039B40D58
MNILLKNKEALIHVFTSFSEQEFLEVNQNLIASWHLLKVPPTQLLNAIAVKNVDIELFLGNKCLPLVRFYLSDKASQKALFLSPQLLAELFMALPPVEAIIFKRLINKAQQVSKSLFSEANAQKRKAKVDLVIQFADFQSRHKKSHTRESLSKLAETEKQYLNCFYYLREGQVTVFPMEIQLMLIRFYTANYLRYNN